MYKFLIDIKAGNGKTMWCLSLSFMVFMLVLVRRRGAEFCNSPLLVLKNVPIVLKFVIHVFVGIEKIKFC